ncbi:glutaredoxin [Prauserella rugosa]|uniref:Glutaredoxin n=1 Tax=Prauserella rugosa TaxID=43354 RepID=A0A660CCJ8_9PSEU|nr:glutaredoxin [Prauserella rugosa]
MPGRRAPTQVDVCHIGAKRCDGRRTVDTVANDEIEFYWRPGCPFCMMLEAQLDATNLPVRKINIWETDGAADRVKAAADGNETVPTVFVGERSLVNPSMTELMDAVRAEAPQLLDN